MSPVSNNLIFIDRWVGFLGYGSDTLVSSDVCFLGEDKSVVEVCKMNDGRKVRVRAW
jgi:hypothetical protein